VAGHRTLLRLAIVWNIPVACNRASADFLISSPLVKRGCERREPDYGEHARAARRRRWRPVALPAARLRSSQEIDG
jgi:hypothetical protein